MKKAPGNPEAFFHTLLILDFIFEEEVVDNYTYPAECEDKDDQKDLLDDVDRLLDDIEHAPDSADDTKDVNDFC